jgi:3-hydroxybutyryl-CoA dehydrogenase
MSEIRSMAIVGAGTMGLGIAQVAAMSGLQTILFDISQEMLIKAKAQIEKNLSKAVELGKLSEAAKAETLQRLYYAKDLSECKAELVLEAIVEKTGC